MARWEGRITIGMWDILKIPTRESKNTWYIKMILRKCSLEPPLPPCNVAQNQLLMSPNDHLQIQNETLKKYLNLYYTDISDGSLFPESWIPEDWSDRVFETVKLCMDRYKKPQFPRRDLTDLHNVMVRS